MDLADILTSDEVLEIGDTMDRITNLQVCETLDELVRREVALLRDSRLGNNPEMREVTRWNVAALCAASIRISSGKLCVGPNEP